MLSSFRLLLCITFYCWMVRLSTWSYPRIGNSATRELCDPIDTEVYRSLNCTNCDIIIMAFISVRVVIIRRLRSRTLLLPDVFNHCHLSSPFHCRYWSFVCACLAIRVSSFRRALYRVTIAAQTDIAGGLSLTKQTNRKGLAAIDQTLLVVISRLAFFLIQVRIFRIASHHFLSPTSFLSFRNSVQLYNHSHQV